MANPFHSLLMVIAGATKSELARQIKFLKVENEILRSRLPARITVTPKERNRLLKFGRKLGTAIHELVSIVSPGTFLRWIREECRADKKCALVKRGRPRTPEQIRRVIIKLAAENDWGYTRILGELKKLGISSISRNTVKRILKEHGLDPGPKRGEGTWDEFIKRHAASLWQCDFVARKVLTWKGWRDAYVVAFLHVGTRQVIITRATLHPNETWVVKQVETFVETARTSGHRVARVQHDRDSKFTNWVNQRLRELRTKPIVNPICAPNTNAFVERFIQSLQRECLDHFVILGERHPSYLCREYLAHYHTERPHQSLSNEPLVTATKTGSRKRKAVAAAKQTIPFSRLRCRQRLGGLLKSYSRAA